MIATISWKLTNLQITMHFPILYAPRHEKGGLFKAPQMFGGVLVSFAWPGGCLPMGLENKGSLCFRAVEG